MNVMLEQVWHDFLKIIKDEVGTRIIDTWIKAVTLSYYDSFKKEVHVIAPNFFIKNWVESHYKQLFIRHLSRLMSVDDLQIIFKVHDASATVTSSESTKIVPAVQIQVKKKKLDIVKRTTFAQDGSLKLNSEYQFDNFIVGSANQFAYASAKAVSEKLGALYNPLLLYGPSGLGKTHLLHAIGNQLQQQHGNLAIMYQTTDRFITEFIQAIRTDSVSKFQSRYKTIDVFLIDDIQFMVNKEQTQEMFFQIFNFLYESKKQIVLTSDTLPRYLTGLVDRLKSRLEWGLIADVQVPSIETKMEILKQKAQQHQELLTDDVAFLIASQNMSNIRELEGTLIRVIAYASLTGQKLTQELVYSVLDIGQEVKTGMNHVDFKMIAAHVKKHFSFDVDQLRSKSRSKGVSLARHVTMYLMKRYTNASLREIGELLMRTDHTTIVHAVSKISQLRQSDEQLSSIIKTIEDELRSV